MVGSTGGKGRTARRGQAALKRELQALSATLSRARRMLASEDGDFLQLGALVVRLCDSIARLQLAQKKIQLGEDTLRACGQSWTRIL